MVIIIFWIHYHTKYNEDTQQFTVKPESQNKRLSTNDYYWYYLQH